MKRLALAVLIAALAFWLAPWDRYTEPLAIILACFMAYGIACALFDGGAWVRRRFL